MFTPFAFVKTVAAAPASNFILDLYPNAAFAHSVRKLRSAYTGNCLQVKRLNDNTTQDIGFDVNGYVDTAAISTFIGANDAEVSIWYDQSGNNIDFTPSGSLGGFQVASAGTLKSLNSKFALYTPNGYQYNLGNASYTNTGTALQILSVSATDAQSAINDYGRIFSYKNTSNFNDYDTCNAFIGFYAYPFSSRMASGQNNNFGNGASTAFSSGTQYIGWHFKDSGTVGTSVNNGSDATATSGCGSTALNINVVRYGNDYKNSDSNLKGYIQEMITWPVYTAADKSGIVTNANDYFGTYG